MLLHKKFLQCCTQILNRLCISHSTWQLMQLCLRLANRIRYAIQKALLRSWSWFSLCIRSMWHCIVFPTHSVPNYICRVENFRLELCHHYGGVLHTKIESFFYCLVVFFFLLDHLPNKHAHMCWKTRKAHLKVTKIKNEYFELLWFRFREYLFTFEGIQGCCICFSVLLLKHSLSGYFFCCK